MTFGADAAYCGIPDFSLRVRINKFDLKDIKQAVEFAHSLNKKLYVTLNIYAHNRHLSKIPAYVKKLKEYNVDALIIADPGIVQIVKKTWPKVKIHLSTQANVTNWSAAKFWYDQGVKRIVLGREVTLPEIKEIHKKVPKLELEYFVHGAMCMAYSGRCLLSKYFTDKSANLGDCTQPCRWDYNVYLEEKKRQGEFLPIEEDQNGTYILNSKDLCLIEHLDKLKDAGVTSFKIEGRAKSIYYVSVISKTYKQAIELLNTGKNVKSEITKLKKELQKVANREFTTGFLFGKEKCEQKYDTAHSISSYEFVGEVINFDNDKFLAYIKPHNKLESGDKVEFIVPNGENFSFTIKEMFDKKNNEKVKSAHGGSGQIVYFKIKKEVKEKSLLRKKK